ncbi:plastocyanin/azurin family copper-binding protein [Actinocrispum sp. NPDC049592]|uniref:OmpL47-type beta-barrel domain-containing protein n=1 Tax=Actinocrispum sp. NPDC049592 TaxID=3154835 RepID=UPI00341EA25C
MFQTVLKRCWVVLLGLALFIPVVVVPVASATIPQPALAQTLTWTADNDITRYKSAPTSATAGQTTIVFENSEATGNTTGMSHTLTFDTDTPGYNHDVNVNILANPFDTENGRHEQTVTLTPGKYRYFCTMPGHQQMVGEFTVGPAGPDTTPPTVNGVVSGNKDGNGNYLGKATVTVTASDTGSGVDKIEYQVDDTSFLPYTAPVDVTAVGDHSVQFRATDKAGNVSPVGSVSFRVVEAPPQDTTPPTVSATVAGNKDPQGNYVDKATVTITASDTQSGVKTVEYSLDGGAFTAYTAPVEVTAVGSHMIHYRATDNAGNTSPEGMTGFTIVQAPPQDTTPPTVNATVAGDKDSNGAYIGKATVTITATDTQSGVKTVEYSLDGGAFTVYTAPVEVTAAGSHMIHYRATDNAGNISPEGMSGFTVVSAPPQDTTPPSVNTTVTGDRDANGNYVNSASVTVTATDAQSGVKTVEYSLDNGAYTAYTAPVVVSAKGSHTLRARATDNAGNTSTPVSTSFTVVEPPVQDTTPPVVSTSVAGNRDANGNYIDSATVSVTATDSQSGVKTVEYSVDGGAFAAYTAPVVVGTNGQHTVQARATDNAGNASAPVSVSFTVVEPSGDVCPDSDTRATVIIGGEDTKVANIDTGNGCTVNDLIAERASYPDHGTFVRHVEDVTSPLVANGVLSRRDQGTIVRAASRSDIGR